MLPHTIKSTNPPLVSHQTRALSSTTNQTKGKMTTHWI